jgi:hypothetical protein
MLGGVTCHRLRITNCFCDLGNEIGGTPAGKEGGEYLD